MSGSRPTNFSVVRLKRDILRRSSVGAAVHRTIGRTERHRDQRASTAIDGTFALLRQPDHQHLLGADAHRRPAGDDTSYRAQLDYAGRPLRRPARAPRRRRQFQSGSRVRAARRHAARTSACFGSARGRGRSSRSASSPGSARWPTSRTARAGSRRATGTGSSRSSSRTAIGSASGYRDTYEFLPRPFAIAPRHHAAGRGLPLRQRARRVQPRPAAEGRAAISWPSTARFYSGHKTAIGVSRGRMNITPQLSVEPSVSINRVDLAEGCVHDPLVGSRVTYTMTPLMFVSALLQYNSEQPRRDGQRAPALGVSARQRAVRRVQRGARHAGARVSRSREPGPHRQGQSPVSVLNRPACGARRRAHRPVPHQFLDCCFLVASSAAFSSARAPFRMPASPGCPRDTRTHKSARRSASRESSRSTASSTSLDRRR